MSRLMERFAIPVAESLAVAAVPTAASIAVAAALFFEMGSSPPWASDALKAVAVLAPIISAIGEYVIVERLRRPESRLFRSKPKFPPEGVTDHKAEVDKSRSDQLSAIARGDAVLQERIQQKSKAKAK